MRTRTLILLLLFLLLLAVKQRSVRYLFSTSVFRGSETNMTSDIVKRQRTVAQTKQAELKWQRNVPPALLNGTVLHMFDDVSPPFSPLKFTASLLLEVFLFSLRISVLQFDLSWQLALECTMIRGNLRVLESRDFS